MSLLPRAGAGALARPLLASSRARAVPRAALPSNIRLRQKWAFEEHPPPAAYPLDYPGDLTDVREDREPDFEPIELPLLRPGETPSKDVQYNGYPEVAPVHARDKPDSQTRYWNAQFRQQWDEVLHPEQEIMTMWAPDPVHNKTAWDLLKPWAVTAGVASIFCGLVAFITPKKQALDRAFVRGGLENEVVGLKLHSYDEDAYKLAEEMEY